MSLTLQKFAFVKKVPKLKLKMMLKPNCNFKNLFRIKILKQSKEDRNSGLPVLEKLAIQKKPKGNILARSRKNLSVLIRVNK